MALNFGILQPVDIAGQFMAGQQQAQQNQLAKQQASMREQEFGMRQQEFATQAEERKLKLDRANERNKFLTDLSGQMEKGGHKLNRETLSSMMTFGLKSNEDSLVNLATKGLQALDEQDQFQSEMGRIAPKPAAAPTTQMQPGALGTGTFDVNAPTTPVNALAPAPVAATAPVNALAAAPVATPSTNAMAGGYTRSQVEQMLTNPNARVREMGKNLLAALPKAVAPAAPSDVSRLIAERNALQPGDPNIAVYDAAIRKASQFAPAASTVIKLPPQEGAFESELGKGQSKRILDSKTAAEDASQILQTNEVGRSLLKSGAITGKGADFLVGLNAGLKQAGIDFGYADAAANSQAYGAAMAANTGNLIKQFGAGTAISDADRAYATKAAAGEITMDETAIRKVLDINDRAARNVIAKHNKSVKGIKTNIPLEVEMPTVAASQPSGASKIPGQGQTPAAPAAAARTVTRTGTLNGRRVIQYSDGSTEYGN